MLKKLTTLFANAARPQTTPALSRPVRLRIDNKHTSLDGVTIKQVKATLSGTDLVQSVKLYDLMMQRDLHLSSTLSQRRDQLHTLEYSIEGDDAYVSFAREYLNHIDAGDVLQELSSALVYGFSVFDLVWESAVIDGHSAFVPVPARLSPRYFSYDNEKRGDLSALYFTRDDKKQYLDRFDTRKIWLHLHKTDSEHITRYSTLYKAAWFVALKHQVIASNMQWFDSLGVPPLIINSNSADEKILDDILYQALSLRSNAVGIFPNGVDIKLLLQGAGTKADFLSFIRYVDEAVSTFITGQSLATGSGDTGSYAQAKTHENRLYEKLSLDARLIAKSLTRLLNMAISANFANPKPVRFDFKLKRYKDLKESSEVIKNLESSGFAVPTDHIESEFGIKGVKRKSEQTAQPNAVWHTNAANVPKAIDKVQAQTSKADLKPVEEALMRRLTQTLQSAESYEEAYELLSADESVDTDLLESLFSRFIANAHLQGLADEI